MATRTAGNVQSAVACISPAMHIRVETTCLFQYEDMVVELTLQDLVRKVNAELLEAIGRHDLKP